jgi:RNA polymerase sigma factor (sigma-70 family)
MCLDGDVRAWETLMWRYRRLIFSIPTKFGLPQYDALDVFQTVCLKLLEHLHEVKDDRKISTWLATTTTRQCLAILTTRQKEFGQQPEVDEPLDPAGTLEDIRLLAERYQQLRDAVEELPARCRSLIEILYLDVKKYNYEQINEKLGIPVASIGPIRARCLNRLRKILNERGIK